MVWAVVHSAERAKHQDRSAYALLPNYFDDRQAVDTGEEPIDDHRIRVGGTRFVQTLYARRRPVHIKSTVGEFRADWAVSRSSSIKSTFGMTCSLPGPAEKGPPDQVWADATGSFASDGVPQGRSGFPAQVTASGVALMRISLPHQICH
jgi:hypothetical protein